MSGPRRHIHLDPVGGIAGDMFIAALLDALPDLKDHVLSEIAAVVPAESAKAGLERGKSGGMAVLRFKVAVVGKAGAHPGAGHHPHDHVHDHHHGQPHHDHEHAHPAEDFRSIVGRLERADLATETRRHALGILTRIAEAESRMHAVPLDKVHFHELADWDSVADVVGAGAILGALGETSWSIGPLPLGGGLVKTAHGRLPVPAPATTVLLEGLPVTDDGVAGERVTPTGAAIAAHLHDGLLRPRPKQARMGPQGMGAGTRNLPDRPNILRALVLDPAQGQAAALITGTRGADARHGSDAG